MLWDHTSHEVLGQLPSTAPLYEVRNFIRPFYLWFKLNLTIVPNAKPFGTSVSLNKLPNFVFCHLPWRKHRRVWAHGSKCASVTKDLVDLLSF